MVVYTYSIEKCGNISENISFYFNIVLLDFFEGLIKRKVGPNQNFYCGIDAVGDRYLGIPILPCGETGAI